MLGHIVTEEQKSDDSRGTGQLRGHKRDLEQGQRQARQEMLCDVGFQ